MTDSLKIPQPGLIQKDFAEDEVGQTLFVRLTACGVSLLTRMILA